MKVEVLKRSLKMSLKEYINHKNKKIKENTENDSEEEEETSLNDIEKK